MAAPRGDVFDPRRHLRLIARNIGSYITRRAAPLCLLVSHRPHIICLQECQLKSNGALVALRTELRSHGYCVHADPEHGLATIHIRGLSLIPVKSLADDKE